MNYLRQLPALALLDRLPTPTLGIESHGGIAYANPACANMLGYVNGHTVTRQPLPELLTGHETLPPLDCLDTLRQASSIVGWNHCHGYTVRTMLSPPLLLRETRTLLLISVTDITALIEATTSTAHVG